VGVGCDLDLSRWLSIPLSQGVPSADLLEGYTYNPRYFQSSLFLLSECPWWERGGVGPKADVSTLRCGFQCGVVFALAVFAVPLGVAEGEHAQQDDSDDHLNASRSAVFSPIPWGAHIC
jgi:hypothetical protein